MLWLFCNRNIRDGLVEPKTRTYNIWLLSRPRRFGWGVRVGWKSSRSMRPGSNCFSCCPEHRGERLLTSFPDLEKGTKDIQFKPVESKTWTYHGQFGSGRTARRLGGARQDGTPTEQFARETCVPCTLQASRKLLLSASTDT